MKADWPALQHEVRSNLGVFKAELDEIANELPEEAKAKLNGAFERLEKNFDATLNVHIKALDELRSRLYDLAK